MVTVRPALPEDCARLADLILLADSGLLSALFPGGPRTTIAFLAGRPANPFSFRHARMIESSGQAAGAAIGARAAAMREERISTALLLLKHYGLRVAVRLVDLYRAGKGVGGLSARDFYLSSIAIYPRFQKRGLGKRLLLQLEEEASGEGCDRLVLDVDPENEGAVFFYSMLGYRWDSVISVELDAQRSFRYRRLQKSLG